MDGSISGRESGGGGVATKRAATTRRIRMTFGPFIVWIPPPGLLARIEPKPFSFQGILMTRHWLSIGLAFAVSLACAHDASAQVKLGVAGPITGGSATFGAQLKNGVEQAVEDINGAGGILRQKIQAPPMVGDDRADPKEGVSVANKFVGEGVKFVVGHFNSGVTIPASEVYQENGILEITPAATTPKVTERNMWNIFRVCGRDDQQGVLAGGIVDEKFKGKRVAMVHDKTTYGQGLADETRKAMNVKGLKEVLYEGINIGDKDYSALVSKIKAARADLVFWGGLHEP